MAEYTNLTSLEGLQVGDTVKYTSDTPIDFSGYSVKVVLDGGYNSEGRQAYGGETSFNIDTSKLRESFLFTTSWGVSLLYRVSSTSDSNYTPYYRIAVAGRAGSLSTGDAKNTGTGGGLTGGKGGSGPLSFYTSGGGGTQTSGGAAGNGGNVGRFGYGGSGSAGTGGAGWYGGGGAKYAGGGGGSGFIIGVSTTTYPSGYLGDDTALQSLIASTISEGTLVNGGGSVSSMTLTILALPAAGTGNSIKYYTNGAWKDATMKVYTKGVWKSASPKVYKDSTWK